MTALNNEINWKPKATGEGNLEIGLLMQMIGIYLGPDFGVFRYQFGEV